MGDTLMGDTLMGDTLMGDTLMGNALRYDTLMSNARSGTVINMLSTCDKELGRHGIARWQIAR